MSDFSFYPNPATDVVNVVCDYIMDSISVYSLDGKLLYDAQVNSSASKVDMSTFAAGIYIFKLRSDNKAASFKVLKQ